MANRDLCVYFYDAKLKMQKSPAYKGIIDFVRRTLQAWHEKLLPAGLRFNLALGRGNYSPFTIASDFSTCSVGEI